MGLFNHKSGDDKQAEDEQYFFDEVFREELRNHGRWYFEKVINENGKLFKEDLDATLAQIRTELKEQITGQLQKAISELKTDLHKEVTQQFEAQFGEYRTEAKAVQDEALKVISDSARTLQQQHKTLSDSVTKNVNEQKDLLHTAFEENKSQLIAMKDAQALAIQWLNQSAQELQAQHKQLSATLEKNVAEQQAILVDRFESNMAQVVEQYVLNAVGDQYDLKAQVPSIIKQLEANKQVMVDDIKL
jgi:hypothetical protein